MTKAHNNDKMTEKEIKKVIFHTLKHIKQNIKKGYLATAKVGLESALEELSLLRGGIQNY